MSYRSGRTRYRRRWYKNSRRRNSRRFFRRHSIDIALWLGMAAMILLVLVGVRTVVSVVQKREPVQVVEEPQVTTQPVKQIMPVIVIDPGHGGIQPGCVFGNVLEKDITLPVSLMVRERLELMGYTVILTRDSDKDVSLPRRSEISNAANANCFVSIHCNSYVQNRSISGFEGYYYQSDQGKSLSDSILTELEADSIHIRETKEENYYVLRETYAPSVLLEIGYLSNETERQNLLDSVYQKRLATGIAKGISAWLDKR